MEYKKEFLDGENIPDFALQPARPASSFDPTVYDRLFENLKQATEEKQPDEAEPAAEVEVMAETESVTEAELITEAGPVADIETVDEIEVAVEEVEDVAEETQVVAEADEIEVAAEEVEDVAEEVEVAEVAAFAGQGVIATKKPLAVVTTMLSGNQRMRTIKYTDYNRLEPVVIQIEEDVLITDLKPDMTEMLCLEGSCRLTERSVSAGTYNDQPVRIAGDLKIQALYASGEDGGEPAIISVESKIPFRDDCMVKAGQNSDLNLCPRIKSLKCEKINERKFRVNAGIEVGIREYCPKEIEVFEGLENEELQLLHKEIEYTDVIVRKNDVIEVSEDISIPDEEVEIDKVLCYKVNLVENQKQIIGEKAMVNGTAYINVLYDSTDGPKFHNCKTDITHFIQMSENRAANPLSGGRTFFDVTNCSITPKKDENGRYSILSLDMEAGLDLEYSSPVQEQCIEDLYHYTKDVECARIQKEFNCMCGSGGTNIPIREIIDIPERYTGAEKVLYITGAPEITEERAIRGRIIIEGVLPVRIVCMGNEGGKQPFAIDRVISFRTDLDMADCREGMKTDCQMVMKNLEFNKINNKQIAVDAAIAVSAQAFEKKPYQLIHNVSIAEKPIDTAHGPSIIVYASKDGDTVWKVAKKYHISTSRVRSVNSLTEHEELKAGAKIVIVR